MTDRAFPVQGICYDAGVLYEHTSLSRRRWAPEEVRRDLRVIRDRLGCDAVAVMATSPDRLLEAGRIAREEGLAVWLQPRVFDVPRPVVAANLALVGERAEALRRDLGEVSLNVGCELSLSVPGFVPGGSFVRRGRALGVVWPLLPVINARLRTFLHELATLARARFAGPLSYGAGEWESVDWSAFDVVGLDLYREASNRSRFEDDLRAHVRRGKPVYVFEFGCCAYVGADERASQAFSVLREVAGELRVPATLVRDEDVQARYLDALFDVFADAGVHATFVWGFSEPELTRSAEDPTRDLDLASYGVVAVEPGSPDEPEAWRPKRAFHTVARRYGAPSET